MTPVCHIPLYMRKSFQMRTRKGKIVFWSLLPRKVSFETSSTQPFTWIRVGLLPGWGSFRSSESVFSFFSFIWIKAPENRTLVIIWGKKENDPLSIEKKMPSSSKYKGVPK